MSATSGARPGSQQAVLAGLFPPETQVCTWDDLVAEGAAEQDAIDGLWSAEAAAAAGFSPKRRTEYATVRACARRALVQAGLPEAAILKGSRGLPMFPPGAVGALTHTEGLRAAVIGRSEAVRGLGLDAEPSGPLPPGVLRTIALPGEQAWVEAVQADTSLLPVDRLLFCAKEATYKAWFPLTRRWLGFEDAEIALRFDAGPVGDPGAKSATGVLATGTVRSRILVDPVAADGGAALAELHGRWAITGRFVAAAIVVPVADTKEGTDV